MKLLLGNRGNITIDNKRKRSLKLLAIISPFFLFIIAINYVPLLGWYTAFVDYLPGVPFYKQEFIGVKEFQLLFSSTSDIFLVLKNTLALSFLVIITTPLPLIFAILLSQIKGSKLSKFIQTVTSLPNFISFILLYAVFFAVFSPEEGAYNIILHKLGALPETSTNILANFDYAWIVQTCVYLFKTTGYTAIIYIAAISGIDPELHDAAHVDGANSFQRIIHIVLPGLMPTFFVIFLLTVANLLSAGGFDQYYVFQNPLTIDKLETIDTYTYKIGMQRNDFPLASAIGSLKSVINLVILFVANYFSKLIRGESII